MLAAIITAWASAPSVIAAAEGVIAFDLPSVASATCDSDDATLVTFQLRLSAIIPDADSPRIDQWLVRCQPRDRNIHIVDYTPRTEISSDLATPIQVKEVEEASRVFGISLDASQGNLVSGHAGTDHIQKSSSTQQFDRLAPQQAVTAAGTINRGRGVYFKLRWTAAQVLEGEKLFSATLRVPSDWRGSLFDVDVVAQSQHKSLVCWNQETKIVGAAEFVVAVYREGDDEAKAIAQSLSDAEQILRDKADQFYRSPPSVTLPSMLRHVAMKLDLQSNPPQPDWLPRLLRDQADPHLDKEIRKLPMKTRLAVLDYDGLRNRFANLNEQLGKQFPTIARH